jgi:hypothetical protein
VALGVRRLQHSLHASYLVANYHCRHHPIGPHLRHDRGVFAYQIGGLYRIKQRPQQRALLVVQRHQFHGSFASHRFLAPAIQASATVGGRPFVFT